MAKKPQVDVRKLKDEVAEYLKKSKWERAAEVLEDLVSAEPKDMSHRLKLGDTYRRMEQVDKAIGSYQYAARVFSDEGQLIKAIGAVKILLELDPANEEAQKQLAEMNGRRFSKVTLENAGLKSRAGIGAGARATSPIELAEADEAVQAVGSALHPELAEADEDAPLELDDGKPASRGPAIPHRGFQPPPAPAKKSRSYDPSAMDELDLDVAPPGPPRPAVRPPVITPPPPPDAIDLDEPEQIEKLPDDAILDPEDLAVPEAETVAAPEDEIRPAAAPPHSVPLRRPSAPLRARQAPGEAITISDEITIEDDEPTHPKAPAAGRGNGPQPIADLLSSEAEEEIELLSISSDEEAAGERPTESPRPGADDADLDSAFGNLSPAAAGRKAVPVKKVPLFDDLSQQAFVELVNRLEYHRHVPGQLIIREGDPGRSFYIIVEGKVRVFKVGPEGKEITLAHLGEGAFFGEMALLSGAPRTANVVAEEDTGILEVSDVVLRELAGKHPQVVSSLKNFYRQRLLNNVMAISPLFKDFDPAERKAIVEKFRMKQAAPAQVLITEGRNSDGLYVVLHGAVLVHAEARDHTPVELAKLKEGDIFGEMSLLTRQPATATVTSMGNSILLRLPRENFQELVVTHPQILELVSTLTDQRRSAKEAILEGQGEGHDGMSFV